MRNQRPSGPLCGCGASQILCECVREQERRKCCEACDHGELPPDVRAQADGARVEGSA